VGPRGDSTPMVRLRRALRETASRIGGPPKTRGYRIVVHAHVD